MLAAGWRPTNLDNGRERTHCVSCRCGWGLLDIFSLGYHLSFLSPSLLYGRMTWEFYVPFSRMSFISGRWVSDEWLCAMETGLRLKRFPLQAGLESESRAARSAGQRLTN